MRIIFASSEVAPYAKTGGLADVAGALPGAITRLGNDARVVMPRYAGINAGKFLIDDLYVPIRFSIKRCSVYLDETGSAPVYFIDAPDYFHRRDVSGRDRLYGESDDAERFAFFSRAVVELCRRLDFQPDIVHCNDWMTGFVPAYLKTVYASDSFFAATGTIFTIHNLGYTGTFDPTLLPAFGFDPGLARTEGGFEFYGAASALKIGIVMSDVISTVSRRYAEEIQTPEYGNGLDGLLRSRKNDVIGILNGVDYREWNPATDTRIAARFSPQDLSGKRLCKADLLRQFNLRKASSDPSITNTNINDEDNARPVMGIVSRLVNQKGIDLVLSVAERILATGSVLIVLGSGEPGYEQTFQRLRDSYPNQVGLYLGFNDELAHKIEAGSDMFLMPSAYEPCGLNQIYSLKYGTIPIVRATGGLDDTIQPFDRGTRHGNGFKFYYYHPQSLLEAVYEALVVYQDPSLWRSLMLNAMSANYSWDIAARQYLEVYQRISAAKRH